MTTFFSFDFFNKKKNEVQRDYDTQTSLVKRCFKVNYMYFLSDYFRSLYLDWFKLLTEIKKVVIWCSNRSCMSNGKLARWSFFFKFYIMYIYIFFTFFGQSLFFMFK